MDFLMQDLLKLKVLEQANFSGDHSCLTKPITGITVMDAPDIADWLKGGELILTSLYPIRSNSDEEMKEWVTHLAAMNVSALIIKIDKVFAKIPEAIVTACELSNIPIITIPFSVAFVDIMYPVMERLLNNKVTELKYFKDVHDKFTALSLADAGIDKIIATLNKLIGNPITIYDRYLHCIATTHQSVSLFHSAERLQLDKFFSTKFAFYTQKVIFPELQDGKYNQVVVPIAAVNNVKISLVINEINHPTVPLDFIAIENAAIALSLELVKQFAVAEVERKFQNDLIDDLIAGRADSLESVYERANVIGWDLEGEHAVVLFHLLANRQVDSMRKWYSKRKQMQEYYHLLSEIINFHLPNGIVRVKSDVIIVLWKIQTDKENKRLWLEQVKKITENIQTKLKNQKKDLVLQVGIGSPAYSILDVPKSYKTAQNALDLGNGFDQRNFITSFDELGIYRLLYQFEDIEQLKKFIPESLNKLVNYRQVTGNDLVETLRVFLQCNQNATKTAQALYIHYKTVSYRIQRIKEIMGFDFENADELLCLQVGLKIIDLLQKGNQNLKQ